METTANANDVENSVDVVDPIHHQHQDQGQDPVPVPDASNSSHGYFPLFNIAVNYYYYWFMIGYWIILGFYHLVILLS